jgi:putative tricarboxylic transport membrane protein
MNSNDAPIGAGLLVLSLLVLWHVSSFPPAPGQPYNAALFPGIAAGGLAIAAIGLIVSGLRHRREQRQANAAPRATEEATRAKDPADDGESADVIAAAKVPSRLLAVLLTAGSILFYIAVAQTLGFVITGVILMSALMWAYGVRPMLVLPVAVVVTLVIHFLFYRLLSVPLPWGLLQPIAW